MATTEHQLREELTEQFSENLEYMREHPQDWQDTIAQIADEFPSVYTYRMVDQWVAIGYPEIDDEGLAGDVTDIHKLIAIAVYEWASSELYALASEAGLG